MGYPRKSYPHRCSPPCAKRSRPRACARVYIIYRSLVGRSRGVSAPLWGRGRTVVTPCPAPACAGWGRAKAKADAPSRSAPHFPRLPPCPCLPTAESLCVKAEVHQANPAPAVRSPRGNLSTAASPPADGRSAERKGGSAQGNPRSCPCVLPAPACLRPCSRPLMGVALCVLPAPACLRPRPRPLMGEAPCVLPATARLRPRPLAQQPALSPPTARAPAA